MPPSLLGRGFRKIGRGFHKIGDWVDAPPVAPAPAASPPAATIPTSPEHTPQMAAHIARLNKWYAADGDQKLRIGTLDLTAESVVFDLGGYDGSYTTELFLRFGCTVYMFEPCRSFFDPVHERLHRNTRIKLYPFGLGAATRTERIAINAAGTSIFRQSEQTEAIELVRAADFFAREPVPEITLLKVNIEGGEYELLDHLIETGLIHRMRDVQVQFHEDVLPDADRRMRAIHAGLAKTHRITWQHEWIWENWRRIDDPSV
jgi:FkbM family methyltransferase